MIKVRNDLELWCNNCETKNIDTVQVELSQQPKRSSGLKIELNTFLCKECFCKIFYYENWLKYWRLVVKKKIQNPKRKEKFLIIKEGVITKL